MLKEELTSQTLPDGSAAALLNCADTLGILACSSVPGFLAQARPSQCAAIGAVIGLGATGLGPSLASIASWPRTQTSSGALALMFVREYVSGGLFKIA